MDIPNLSQTPSSVDINLSTSKNSPFILLIVVSLAVAFGFWASRLSPSGGANNLLPGSPSSGQAVSINDSTSPQDLKVGVVYGNQAKNFKDRAQGTIEQGSINGEGTHILVREGGLSQRASLTSSVVDLDLFVGKMVEVTGETNASAKTSWFMDVGTIKILQ
jgi:hypothetical protein